MRDPQLIAANEDERLIPEWATSVAAVAFVMVEYYFWLILPTQQRTFAHVGFSHQFVRHHDERSDDCRHSTHDYTVHLSDRHDDARPADRQDRKNVRDGKK